MGRVSAPLRREGGRTAAPQAAPDDAFDGKAFVLQQLGSELSSQGVLLLAVRLVYVRDNAHARFPALAHTVGMEKERVRQLGRQDLPLLRVRRVYADSRRIDHGESRGILSGQLENQSGFSAAADEIDDRGYLEAELLSKQAHDFYRESAFGRWPA